MRTMSQSSLIDEGCLVVMADSVVEASSIVEASSAVRSSPAAKSSPANDSAIKSKLKIKPKVKLIMFDLDGTLMHTAPELATAINLMLVDLGLQTLPASQIQSYIGEGAVVLLKRCLTGKLNTEPDEALLNKAQIIFFAHYAQHLTLSLPFDGVIDALQALQNKDYKLACVTNKPAQFAQPLLLKSGLNHFFEMVVSGDTLSKKKPDPMQLLHICATLNVPIEQALLVGDSATDIAAAKAAGCFIVTVPYGYNQGRVIDESSVDANIEDLTQLIALLE